jgi:hypothetical protein
LFGREKFLVGLIEEEIVGKVPRENVVDIDEEIGNVFDVNRAPQYKAEKVTPEAAIAPAPETGVPVDHSLSVDRDDLLQLPDRVEWEASIRLGDVSLEQDQRAIRERLTGGDDTAAQTLHPV